MRGIRGIGSQGTRSCNDCDEAMDYRHACLGCGIEYCYGCGNTQLIKYSQGVFFQGRGDGAFCRSCDDNPPDHIKELHQAYNVIQSLRFENAFVHAGLEERAHEAEERLKELLEG